LFNNNLYNKKKWFAYTRSDHPNGIENLKS
jgi:hypothetical protein